MSMRKMPKENNFFVAASNILTNNVFGAEQGSSQMTLLCDNLVSGSPILRLVKQY